MKQQSRQKYWNNPEKYRELSRKWARGHLEKIKQRDKRYTRELKLEALQHYGGEKPICACCGEHRLEFLNIDHINGKGHEHGHQIFKHQIGGGKNFYQWLKRNNYPQGFRVLCYNCNCSIGSFGYCSHELEQRGSLIHSKP